MQVVIALGGNALLRRGQAMTAGNLRQNTGIAAAVLAPLCRDHQAVLTHGSGPQIGLLALQNAAYHQVAPYPLDILDAEVEGMIGYVLEQELRNLLPSRIPVATLLTQIEVDPSDSALDQATKPIGPRYDAAEARRLAERNGWHIVPDGDRFRRAVPSPAPLRILQIDTIRLLVGSGTVLICAGGGGIPVRRRADGTLAGIEAVIDKDAASALLARELAAEAFLMLTDVDAVWQDWQQPAARRIRRISSNALRGMAFEAGTMAPKVAAACDFVDRGGAVAGIGRLEDAAAILAGTAGTTVLPGAVETAYWD